MAEAGRRRLRRRVDAGDAVAPREPRGPAIPPAVVAIAAEAPAAEAPAAPVAVIAALPPAPIAPDAAFVAGDDIPLAALIAADDDIPLADLVRPVLAVALEPGVPPPPAAIIGPHADGAHVRGPARGDRTKWLELQCLTCRGKAGQIKLFADNYVPTWHMRVWDAHAHKYPEGGPGYTRKAAHLCGGVGDEYAREWVFANKPCCR